MSGSAQPPAAPPPATPAPAGDGAPPARRTHSRLLWWVSKWSVRAWARVWLRARYEGVANVPATGPVLLVANHASYLDPPLIGISASRWVGFLAQSGLAGFGPLRWWMAGMGVTLIDRNAPSKAAIQQISRFLAAGDCIGIFPEGTRTRDGSVGPFRQGVEFLVRRTKATVVPVGLDGPFRAFGPGKLFPRPRRCTIRYGRAWSPAEVLAPGGVEALRAEVAALARMPLRNEAPPQSQQPSPPQSASPS